jgi:Mor family transcriptional regulator
MNQSAEILFRHGETRTDAEKLSRDFALEVCRRLASTTMYSGKNTYREAEAKYKLIRDDHQNNKTIEQLSIKYHLSTRRIYDILYHMKGKDAAKAATTGAPAMAVIATRMMIKIGLGQEDAASEARGLLAVIAAKFGGTAFSIPKENSVRRIIRQIEVYRLHKAGKSISKLAGIFELPEQDITTIIEQYPVSRLTVSKTGLMLLNKRVLEVAGEYGEFNPEVSRLLSVAAENVNRACKIIAVLEQQKGDPSHVEQTTTASL